MKIKLKRSSKDQAPTSEQLVLGELALSYNAANPQIYVKNTDGNIVPISGKTFWESTVVADDTDYLYPKESDTTLVLGGTDENALIRMDSAGNIYCETLDTDAVLTDDISVQNNITCMNYISAGTSVDTPNVDTDNIVSGNFDFSELTALPA